MSTIFNFLDLICFLGLFYSVIWGLIVTIAISLNREARMLADAVGYNIWFHGLKKPLLLAVLSGAWLVAPYLK